MISTIVRRFGLVAAALAALAGILGAAGAPAVALAAKASPTTPNVGLATDVVEIQTMRGRARFTVELAVTPIQQERGLMFRKSLAPDRGMLFPFKPVRPAAFWMKNTLIPLDIIYIAPSGKVLSIARNAVPHDETPLPSGGVVGAVLEIPGGRASQLGILPGDRVFNKIFPKP
ncbi:MAG: DUF192 domain-containing protein [Caulobacter sp.]|nr:DUF192 domain-containing protein [Caulobacter sp.]